MQIRFLLYYRLWFRIKANRNSLSIPRHSLPPEFGGPHCSWRLSTQLLQEPSVWCPNSNPWRPLEHCLWRSMQVSAAQHRLSPFISSRTQGDSSLPCIYSVKPSRSWWLPTLGAAFGTPSAALTFLSPLRVYPWWPLPSGIRKPERARIWSDQAMLN